MFSLSLKRSDVHFAATALVGAYLLFLVQPLLSKYILPWFGGSPAVWSTCVLFFQVALCGGYAYAYVSEHWLRPRWRIWVHIAMIVAAIGMLPIAPSEVWRPDPTTAPTKQILLLLAVCVGLPYIVLASTGPLVQAWFARTFPDRSPYRLYALSNLGSLLALVSYPLFVEPALSAVAQAWWWSCGFAVFTLLLGGAALRAARQTTSAMPSEPTETPLAPWWTSGLWLALPALASMMLLATTNHVWQDVASIPLLWVAPLALYLLSFIIAFDHARWYWRVPLSIALLVGVYVAVGIDNLHAWSSLQAVNEFSAWMTGRQLRTWDPTIGYRAQLAVFLTVLFLVCLICHGELYRLRPPPRWLTGYYLLISSGGALGGVLVNFVAPFFFQTYLEWSIGLVSSFVLAAIVLSSALWLRRYEGDRGLRIGGLVGASVLVLTALAMGDMHRLLRPRVSIGEVVVTRDRNFYGTVRVTRRGDGSRTLYSGHVVHGVQLDYRPHLPTTYYAPASGVGSAIDFYQQRGPLRLGGVGLGVGTIAAYAQPGDSLRFFEINPAMIEIAHEQFSFLGDARKRGAAIDIVTGDGRLSLAAESAQPTQRYDLLVLDAFSGDAVPNHLLTAEALAIYESRLAEGGAIAFHISNRYLNLGLVVQGLAERHRWSSLRIVSPADAPRAVARADWIILTRNPEFMAALRPLAQPDVPHLRELPAWTDQRNNVLEILR